MSNVNLPLGRNDPCWCGSGKLYKHCHRREDLEREKEAQRAATAEWVEERNREAELKAAERAEEEGEMEAALPAGPSLKEVETLAGALAEPEISPEEAAADARWEEFEAASLETKFATLESGLDTGEIDAEEAYEMSSVIREKLDIRHNPGDRRRYAELVARIRQFPELYQENRAYFATDLIEDAIIDEQWDAIPDLLDEFAQDPNLDVFVHSVVDGLMYHGQTRALRQAMEKMWPDVSSSDELMPWASEEFASRLLTLIFLDYVQTADTPRVDDPALHQMSAPYGSFYVEWLETMVQHLSAPAPAAWQPADFGATVDADQWGHNLQAILADLMADQSRHQGVPLSRSYLFFEEFGGFLRQQMAPRLSADQRRSGKKARRAQGRRRAGVRLAWSLMPDRDALDHFLAEKFQFLGSEPYRAGAIMELLPAYLHFLARVGAIHPDQMDAALEEFPSLAGEVQRLVGSFALDPHLPQAIEQAWSEETLSRLRADPALAEARSVPVSSAAEPAEPERQSGAIQTFTFRVTYLRDREVWREIEMLETQTLDDLHSAILHSIDFDFDHQYSFYMNNIAWDRTAEYSASGAKGPDANQVKIGALELRMKQRFLYLYDYGDEHRFEVQLVGQNPDAPQDRYPKIVDSHGEAPAQYGFWDEDEDWDEVEDWDEEEDWDVEEDWDEDE